MSFGESVPGYKVKVFNEREVRAAAGILFLFAFIVFNQAFFLSNFEPLKIFITFFLFDFLIRMVKPDYAPSMIMGRLATRNQRPEYSGAPQKRFAWGIGLALASVMFIIVTILDLRGLFNLAVCIVCLIFLFFEAAFGICIGCKMYNLFTKKKAKHCPGGVCEMKTLSKKITPPQILMILIPAILILFSLYI